MSAFSPELTVTAYRRPVCSAHQLSSLSPTGPIVSHPLSSTERMASDASGGIVTE